MAIKSSFLHSLHDRYELTTSLVFFKSKKKKNRRTSIYFLIQKYNDERNYTDKNQICHVFNLIKNKY